MSEERAAEPCLNCGAALSGAYCASCGQRHIPLTSIGLWTLLREGLDGVADKLGLLKDLGWLLVNPGRLTANWLAGHRIRHLQPVKTWLLCTAIGALVATLGAQELDAWVATVSDVDPSTLGPGRRQAVAGLQQLTDFAWTVLVQLITLVLLPLVFRLLHGPHSRGSVAFVLASLHAGAAQTVAQSLALIALSMAGVDFADPTDLRGLWMVPIGLATQVWYGVAVLRSGLGLGWRQSAIAAVGGAGVFWAVIVTTLALQALVMGAVIEALIAT